MMRYLAIAVLLLCSAPLFGQACTNPGTGNVCAPASQNTATVAKHGNGTAADGSWALVNHASDTSSSDLGCYSSGQIVPSLRALTLQMVTGGTYTCGQSDTTQGAQSYLTGSMMWNNLNYKPSEMSSGHVTIEVKAKFGVGWGAIWLLGGSGNLSTDAGCQYSSIFHSWNNVDHCNWSSDASDSSEVDIGETTSWNGLTSVSHNKFVNNGSVSCSQNVTNYTTNFHVYHIDWSASAIDMKVDGVDANCGYTSAIPQNPMFLILENRQQAGNTVGGLPTTMTVQYVQVCDGTSCTAVDSAAGNTLFLDDFALPAPKVFFTDITSGPNTGGENGNGSILTIYGKNFGATRGTSAVTVGGGQVASYLQWGGRSKAGTAAAQLETISVALGASAATGTVAVNTSVGASTCEDTKDNCQFTVRSGNIRCISTAGNDANAGTFPSSCWRTIVKGKDTLAAGDIGYVLTGVNQTTQDNFSAALSVVGNNCTTLLPCALVAYPGATSTIGTTSLGYGIRTPATGGVKDNWVFAGFNVTGLAALDLLSVTGWRVINNDFNCPLGSGQSACMHTDTVTQYRFYGNYTHNVGDQSGAIDKFYHGNYFTTNTNHVWMGWNEVNNNPNGSVTQGGCRAVQFFSTGGADQFDLHVHDNWLHNSICDGINFSTVNADNGTVEAYNNVIYHVGTGPDPGNGASDYACLVAGGGGTTAVLAYNNTMYDCGGRKAADSGGVFVARALSMWNNITQQLTGEVYLTSSSVASSLNGSNNIWTGVAGAPTQTTGNITTAPNFTAPGSDFTIPQSSPANGAGTAAHASAFDFTGSSRPSPPSIGAYEFSSGAAAASTPTFTPVAGTYTGTQSVTISTTSAGAIICYNTTGSPATNGSTGCTTGTLYSGPVTVSTGRTLFAVAGGTGFGDSGVGSAAYTINPSLNMSGAATMSGSAVMK